MTLKQKKSKDFHKGVHTVKYEIHEIDEEIRQLEKRVAYLKDIRKRSMRSFYEMKLYHHRIKKEVLDGRQTGN